MSRTSWRNVSSLLVVEYMAVLSQQSPLYFTKHVFYFMDIRSLLLKSWIVSSLPYSCLINNLTIVVKLKIQEFIDKYFNKLKFSLSLLETNDHTVTTTWCVFLVSISVFFSKKYGRFLSWKVKSILCSNRFRNRT